MPNDHTSQQLQAEFERLGLDPRTMPGSGLAFSNADAFTQFIAHLRTLTKGATWSDAFGDERSIDAVEQERSLGSFDYEDAPRGSAVFAALDGDRNLADGEIALNKLASLGIAIYGAGLVLDRGHPHLYVVVPRGAPSEHVEAIVTFLREQPGIASAYGVRDENAPDENV